MFAKHLKDSKVLTTPKRYKAFTLAEVLITLAVIGVVAAMSIPSLMNTTSDKELKTKWKKAYAAIANAYQLEKSESGGLSTFNDSFNARYDIFKSIAGRMNAEVGNLAYINYFESESQMNDSYKTLD